VRTPLPHLRHSAAAIRVGVLGWLGVFSCALLLLGCSRQAEPQRPAGYVTAPQVSLRDRLAAVHNKVAVLENGQRVEILETRSRMVRVRTARGQEGWMEARHLASEAVFRAFRQLAAGNVSAPIAAHGSARAPLNMHVAPGRKTDRLYRMNEGEKIEILRRATAERTLPQAAAEQPPVLEDWWLVRDTRGHVGWVLGRMMDLDVPLEVAQYAEGQRIVASFVISHAEDEGRQVPQYLLLLTGPRDGLPFDFNQVRIFTWNAGRDRYETAYRERRLFGRLPARVTREKFEKEGELPVFILRVQQPDESWEERKYKMNGVIVRRVLPAGAEAPPRKPR